jgi:predicted GNAT family acetyltransferase
VAVDVTDVPDAQRYEARVDGAIAGILSYRTQGDLVRLVHTEVDPSFEGRGVGGALARASLDDLARRGLRAEVDCPFVRGWIDRHPDYVDRVT